MVFRSGLAILAAACNGGGSDRERIEVTDLSSEVSDEVSTVVTVRWTTAEPATGRVVFGAASAVERSTPEEETASADHEAILLGLPPETDVRWRVVLDGGAGESEEQLATTGSLPGELPALEVEGDGNDRWLVTPILGLATAALIVSPEGEIVWYRLDGSGLDTYRVRLARDGSGVLYNRASISGDPAEDSSIVRVSFDGTEEVEIAIPLLAHDFVELPDGTLAAIGFEYREGGDGTTVLGNRLVEVSPDGTQRDVWTSWDCFDPDETPGDDPDHAWTFANALDYDEDLDAYLVGMRNMSGIARVDRATGACPWTFGGAAGTVEISGGSDVFLHQHQFEIREGTALVFDNEGAAGTVSRVLEFAFDPEAGTAEEIWSYTADPPVYSFVLGDVARLDDGDTLVTWSAGGQVDRVNAAGDREWKLNTPLGYAFGFDATVEDLDASR